MRIRLAVPVLVVGLLAGCSGSPATVDTGASAPPASTGATAGGAGDATPAPGSAGASAGASGAGGAAGDQGGTGADSGTTVLSARTIDAAEFATNLRNAAVAKRTATVHLSGADGMSADGAVRYGQDLALTMTMHVGAQKVRMIFLDGAYYVDSGQKVNGKTWMKIDEKGTDPISKAMAPVLGSLRQNTDVTGPPSAFKGSKAVGRAGPILAGEPTIAFTVKLSSKQLVAALSPEMRKLAGASLAGTTSVSTYYVDSQWLPRKVVVVTTVKGKKSTTTVTYAKWGGPITVAAPPAAQTITSPGAAAA